MAALWRMATMRLWAGLLAAANLSESVLITDNAANSPQSVSVSGTGIGGITLSPPTLPNGIVGVPYSQTLTVASGGGPYWFAIISGPAPNAGLALGQSGTLTGTPTAAGTTTLTVGVSTSNPLSGNATYQTAGIYTLTINQDTFSTKSKRGPCARHPDWAISERYRVLEQASVKSESG
jgi:hypothetical protein